MSYVLSLSRITKELLRKYNFRPKKRLGQHFLIDSGVLQRIIEAAELSSEDVVWEIGTGLGTLTAELTKRVKEVITIEIDKKLIQIAKDFLKSYDNITIIEGDFLKIDLGFSSKNFKVVANLPYYITAPIIEKLLEVRSSKLASSPNIQLPISRIVLTLQKEVAQRLIAKPGTKIYGSFTIFVQYHAEVKLHSLIPKSAFYPQPEVGSAIVILKPYKISPFKVRNEKIFFDIIHAAFQQRRKKLKNSLAKYNLEGISIDLNQRPETLKIEEFVEISNYLCGF